MKPTFDNAAAITAQVRDASAILLRLDALPDQLLGLTEAAKVTLGQTAETMRDTQHKDKIAYDRVPETSWRLVGNRYLTGLRKGCPLIASVTKRTISPD